MAFDTDHAAVALACTPADTWHAFWRDWPVVNDLAEQKKISKDTSACDFFMSREDVLSRFPATEDLEKRYKALL